MCVNRKSDQSFSIDTVTHSSPLFAGQACVIFASKRMFFKPVVKDIDHIPCKTTLLIDIRSHLHTCEHSRINGQDKVRESRRNVVTGVTLLCCNIIAAILILTAVSNLFRQSTVSQFIYLFHCLIKNIPILMFWPT